MKAKNNEGDYVYMKIKEEVEEEKRHLVTEDNIIPILGIVCTALVCAAIALALIIQGTILQETCIQHYGDWDNGYCLFDKPAK